jgi:hypothetical protein
VPLLPGFGLLAAGVVAAVAVDEDEAPEALAVQRVEQVAHDRLVRRHAQRRTPGIRGEVRRQAVGKRRQHEHAERLRRLDRDALGVDPVDAERQVRVLLDRAERDDDPVLVLQVLLDLHPVAVLDLQGLTSS